MPPVSAALGMAAAYYGYPLFNSVSRGQYLLPALLFLLIAAVSFFRVLCLPFYGKNDGGNVPPLLLKINILVIAAAVGFTLGIASRRTVPGPAEMGLPADRVTAVSGILREDPRSLNSGSGMGILELRTCAAQGGLRASARGSITVFFPAESIPRLKEFGRGSEIYVDGVLVASAGDKGVLNRGVLFRAVSLHVVKPAPPLETFRTGLRTALVEKFRSRGSSSPPVWGSLASALLLGVRDDLDTELTGAFRNSGCAHVLALSGMHLAIISGILAFFLRRPLGIRWASLVGAVFILLYVFVAGSQPSLVRAAIMYLIAVFALWGLLKGKVLSLLGMAFIIQLVFQSETGTSLSFILSYLAMGGILTLGETLRALFRGRLPEIINGALCASLGAFILTAPVVVYYFGTLKPIGILAGLVVVPLSSLFMILSLAALAAAFMPFPLWNILDFVLSALYRFLEFIVSLAGRVPGFNVSNPAPVLVISLFLWLLILFIRRQDRLGRNSVAPLD